MMPEGISHATCPPMPKRVDAFGVFGVPDFRNGPTSSAHLVLSVRLLPAAAPSAVSPGPAFSASLVRVAPGMRSQFGFWFIGHLGLL